MNRVKLVIAGFLSAVLFFLIRDGFLAECGLDIVGNLKANFFLAGAVIGLVIVGLLVTGKYKGWIASIPIICFATLIAIGISAWNTSCDENRQLKKDTFREKIDKEEKRIEAKLARKQAFKKLGLSQEKFIPTTSHPATFYPTTTTSPKRVETSSPLGSWGGKIATSTYPEVVNSWSRFAQTETRKAMQRVANPGNRVKIE